MTVQPLAAPAAEREVAPPLPLAPIRRRFLRVAARRVHYLRAGEGPPVVLVHSSPANAWLLRPEIERLARDYTVFAFDTPGFGRSDPLPLGDMSVTDLADALAETLDAIAMPPCPIYGTHTGAAIALEFGARHSDKVTGLVLDGVPAFTKAEFDALFGGYFRSFPVSDLGGHYTDLWTRFRDQYVWFPWTARGPAALNGYDLGQPENVHAWLSMYFDAADHYMPAYRAALSYGDGAIHAAARLNRPAIFTATSTDMLFSHLERLPPLKPGQEIRRIGREPLAKHDLIVEGFARFATSASAPADPELSQGDGIGRQFLDRRDGGQLLVRMAGRRDAPPLLLVHDSPGSAEALEPLIEALATERFVIAPDLPGAGDSNAFTGDGAADIAAYAAVLDEVLRAVGVARTAVHGVGFGASAAMELARAFPQRVERLSLEGLLLPSDAERADLKARYAPPISIEPDGAHWYRTWLMLRDQRIWSPWYNRTLEAQRKRPGDFDAQRLHRLTVDVMCHRESYGQPIRAALAQDAAAALAVVACPVVRVVESATPVSAYDARLRELAPGTPEARAQDDPTAHARVIFTFAGEVI